MASYYSQRLGRGPLANPSLQDVARVLTLAVNEMQRLEYLQEWFGKDCVDNPDDLGKSAMPLVDYIEVETGRRNAWPIAEDFGPKLAEEFEPSLQPWEDELFDLMEFFFLHVSAGVTGDFHNYNGCGWHYEVFDPGPARQRFRDRLNRTLSSYGDGFRLSNEGRVERTAETGLDELLDTPIRTKDPAIAERVAGAVALFRNRNRSPDDLRNAVRNTFDALEKMRPEIKVHMMKGDEGALFEIANKYTVRHLDAKQRGEYDSALWHSWMFYVNLSTIHLMTRTISREDARR
ncbi:hypothetical protein [Actinomycetospora succinea]|uniref:hypothetical protein n=1 Tax=Actinomycetospora succinea TaxID=663603 RepID=UPI00105C07D8|nr:hypothetical protein [Actinomycetospora succinea]